MSGYRIPVTSFLLTNVESFQSIIQSVSIGDILTIRTTNDSKDIYVYKNDDLCGYIHKNVMRSGIPLERVQVFGKERIVSERDDILTLRVVPIHRGRMP